MNQINQTKSKVYEIFFPSKLYDDVLFTSLLPLVLSI